MRRAPIYALGTRTVYEGEASPPSLPGKVRGKKLSVAPYISLVLVEAGHMRAGKKRSLQ